VSATAQVGAGPVVSITQTAGVTVNPAGVSAALSSVSAAPGTITASNGSSASTLTVTVKDQFGNAIQGASVVLSATPTTGNTLSQPAGTTNSSGVATGTLSSTSAETKTVSATAQVSGGPVSITQTATVTVNHAGADHLVFTAQPSNSQADPNIISPPVVVEIRDAFDNLVNDATDQITLTITSGTGTPLAQLFGTNPKAAAGGIATFSDLSIDLSGIGYRLDANASGMTGVTSDQFNITP